MNKEQKYITYADLLKILTRLKTNSDNNLTGAIEEAEIRYKAALKKQAEDIEEVIDLERTDREAGDTKLANDLNDSISVEKADRINADKDLKQTLTQYTDTKVIDMVGDLSQRFVSKFVCTINSFGDILNYQERKKGQYYIANRDFRVEEDSSVSPFYRQIKQGDRIVILKDGTYLHYGNYLDAWKIISQDENGEYLLDREVPVEFYPIEHETDLPDYISTLSYDVDPISSDLPHIDDEGTRALINAKTQDIPDNELIVGEDGILLTDEDLMDIYLQNK